MTDGSGPTQNREAMRHRLAALRLEAGVQRRLTVAERRKSVEIQEILAESCRTAAERAERRRR